MHMLQLLRGVGGRVRAHAHFGLATQTDHDPKCLIWHLFVDAEKKLHTSTDGRLYIFADCILFDFQAGLSLGSIDLGSRDRYSATPCWSKTEDTICFHDFWHTRNLTDVFCLILFWCQVQVSELPGAHLAPSV